MKVLFMGTPAFATATLDSLSAAGHRILAAVTRPDAASGRGLKTHPSPVKQLAARRGIPVLQPGSVRTPEFHRQVESLSPDIVVVVAFGRILPRPLLETAPHGAVNGHASLLPKYRGAAPVAWAIARGETHTGVTTMRMVKRLDAGDILLQRSTPIGPVETTGQLEKRLSAMTAELLVETVARLESGSLESRRQEESEATYAPMLKKEDGRVDWTLGAGEIACRVRAFDPWPGAFTTVGSPRPRRLVLRKARVVEIPGGEEPGTVLDVAREDGVLIACGRDTGLLVLEVQPEGRRRMRAQEAASGRYLRAGDRLGGA